MRDAEIDINHDEIGHAISNSFHGSSVQAKDVISVKRYSMLPQRYFSAMKQSDFD